MTVKFQADWVEQNCWAYLTTVLKFPEKSAAAIMGAWANESNRHTTTPDPTSIEGIFDEKLTIGPKKQKASSNWGAYGPTVAVSSFYTAKDGVTYPGMGMWGITGDNVLTLFDEAKKSNQQWYDLHPQLTAWKRTYIDGLMDSGRTQMLNALKRGDGDIATLNSYAYGLIAYGQPFYQATAVDSAQRIYDKHHGKSYEYSADSGQSGDGSNKLEEFVQKCLSYKGTRSADWAAKHPKWYHEGVWCAVFVSACGEEVGILGKVFDGSASAYTCAHSVEKYGGKVHNEKSYTPQRGDLINFMWGGGSVTGGYADHIGVVTSCSNGIVHTIEGNTSDMVAERHYSRNSACLACFCTPDWSRVGSMEAVVGGLSGKLFDEVNTREDAIVREVAHLETVYDEKNKNKVKEYKPNLKDTGIDLSIVNYTELMAAFWDAGADTVNVGDGSGDGEYDYSKMDPKVREIVKFLTGKGLNNAAACGIVGNIESESNFNTAAVGDGGTSFGICQWHNERGAAMKQTAGSNWANNLTGQLEYLWTELESNYRSSTLDPLKFVENTEAGCKNAADIFVRNFEKPAAVDAASVKRQSNAVKYFKQIVRIEKSTSSSFSSVNLANVSSEKRSRVERARSCLGKPYVWGAVGPSGYDCSGLVSYCVLGKHERLGITDTFMTYPKAKNPEPGDICTNYQHCGLYIGDNKMIHAADYGIGVIEGPVQSGMIIVTYG